MHDNEQFALRDKLTVLVNSCDTYEDLWIPFFSLYRKYWEDNTVRLMLNTESKDFSLDGLHIDCVHCDEKEYGARMLNALSAVETEYVLILLDDFFLRKPVNMSRIREIIKWMDEDQNIVYFNSDCTEVYVDWEVNRYPGFRRIPPGTEYVLNLQAAIWRTDLLKSYWKSNVSPWEWEEFVNIRTFSEKDRKFYCTTDWSNAICDYGYNATGMGVFRGKWVIEDVRPLFEKEMISVDFSQRGYYDPKQDTGRVNFTTRTTWYACVIRCMGFLNLLGYLTHRIYYKLFSAMGIKVESDYIKHYQRRIQRNFIKHMGDV